MTLVIDSLAIATDGLLVGQNPNIIDTLSIATNGLYIVITEEIIDELVPPVKIGGAMDASMMVGPYDHYKTEKKKKKRITASTIIEGITYTNTIEVDDITITAKDIIVEVSDSTIPQLKITVMRGKK